MKAGVPADHGEFERVTFPPIEEAEYEKGEKIT